MSSFGPVLLSKVLGLNDVQESSLGLVFHYADQAGLPMLDLKDLRAVLTHLTSDEGQAELKNIGGLSASTVGVILRTLITFADQGAEAFFGEPEFDAADLLRVTRDGRGVVSLVGVAQPDGPQAEAAERERWGREAAAQAEAAAKERARAQAAAEREARAAARAQSRSPQRREKSVVEQITDSSAFKQLARTAGTEIVRSIFGTARRSRRR
jgi:DNA helicase HerA-like ATPase